MAGTSSRGNPSLGDIVRSVAVMGAIILVLWLVGRVFTVTPDEPPVSTVDYASILPAAERETGFDLLAPTSLPDGWRATSARVRDGAWYLGVLTRDDDDFVGLTQAEGEEADVVDDVAGPSDRDGTAELGGATWTRWTVVDGGLAYSRQVDGTTAVVESSIDRGTLEAYVASLS